MPSCRISPKPQDHAEDTLFQWGLPIFPILANLLTGEVTVALGQGVSVVSS